MASRPDTSEIRRASRSGDASILTQDGWCAQAAHFAIGGVWMVRAANGWAGFL
jgi:hypothetical protein